MLRLDKFLEGLDKFVFTFFLGVYIHKIVENYVFLLLVSQEKQGYPFLNRLRNNLIEAELIRIDYFMVYYKLKETCHNLHFIDQTFFYFMNFPENLA